MGAGLLQVAAKGEQGAYLTGNPDITFFKLVYNRHTNFAMESIRVDFEQEPALGHQCTVVVPRLGDLLHNCYLQVCLTKKANMYPDSQAGYYPAEHLIKDVTLSIGGQAIDRHTGDWLRIFDSLHREPEKSEHYKRLTNFDPAGVSSEMEFTETLYLPLCFYFTRSPGLAIPLISLYFSEVKLTFSFRDAAEVGVLSDGFEAALYCDYVYLDDTERRRFLGKPHEYLVEQVQTQQFDLTAEEAPREDGQSRFNAKLNFSHPVKALYWVLKQTDPVPGRTMHARYVGDPVDTFLTFQPNPHSGFHGYGMYQVVSEKLAPVHKARLTFNGVDRFSERPGTYFNKVQPYQHTRRAPNPGIYMYSFALNPEDIQPSGTCNFSMIDTSELQLTFKQSVSSGIISDTFRRAGAEQFARNIAGMKTLLVFAWNYNILRVENGMSTLVFVR